MKTYNHLYSDRRNFESFLEGTALDKEKPALIRIHSCVHTADEIAVISAEISMILPNAKIIGCSTSGVICDGKINHNACLVSISTFDKSEIETFYSDSFQNEKKLCMELSDKLVKGRNGFMLLFLPASFTKGIRLAEAMNKNLPGISVIGGIADGRTKRQCYTLSGSRVGGKAVSAAFISSGSLQSYENFVCGADIAGKKFTVTKVHNCRIESVDNTDGERWYAKHIDKEELKKDSELSMLFPIIRISDINIPYLVKYNSKKEDRLNIVCQIPKDSRISMGFFDPQKTIEEMKLLYSEIKNAPSESIFAYDCHARMAVMHNCTKWETGLFDTTNISGALLAGELVCRDGRIYFANFTFAAASLSENENARISLKDIYFDDASVIGQNNLKAVSYLLKVSNKELSEQLGDDGNKIRTTLFSGIIPGLGNQLSFLYDKGQKGLDKIALYSLENERMLKLFAGRARLFNEIIQVFGDVMERLNNIPHIYVYSYEETSLLISAEKCIAMDRFEKIAKDILEYLNNISVGDIKMSYICAVTEDAQKPLHMAETALQYCSEHDLSYINIDMIKGNILDSTEEIHILQVIRDAISEERIMPFFQGIYDNILGKIGLYESLMRLTDSKGKIYFPNQFLPVAKKYGLYEMLSVRMVKKVMEMFTDSDVCVTINLNVRDIYCREMIKVIFEHLDKAAHPEKFVFELMESEQVTDYAYIKKFADRIHEKKAKIAIDDFGSGFSNLLHILKIDAEYLKIDGEIIRSICDDEKSRQFVSMINSWCDSQKKQVIAEFVENSEIQGVLESIGVVYSQGYYFSKPVPWEKCEKRK